MPQTSQVQREWDIGMIDAEMSVAAAARQLNVHHTTISRLKSRVQRSGSTNNRPHARGPRVIPAQGRYIQLLHLRNRFETATNTADRLSGLVNKRISPQTLMNRLRNFGIRARRPKVGLALMARTSMA